jgi:hypothetical protein
MTTEQPAHPTDRPSSSQPSVHIQPAGKAAGCPSTTRLSVHQCVLPVFIAEPPAEIVGKSLAEFKSTPAKIGQNPYASGTSSRYSRWKPDSNVSL